MPARLTATTWEYLKAARKAFEALQPSKMKLLIALKPLSQMGIAIKGSDPSMKDRPLTIAVDFDGVIADYDEWKGDEVSGPPREDVITTLQVLRSEGWKIVIYSTRGTEEIRPYLTKNGVPFDEINQNSSYQTKGVKPIATVYWDDRACRYSGDARKDLEIIRNFRTWNGRR